MHCALSPHAVCLHVAAAQLDAVSVDAEPLTVFTFSDVTVLVMTATCAIMQLGGSAVGIPDASSSSPRKAVVKKKRKKRRVKQSRLGQLAGMTDEEKSIWLFKHCEVQQGLPVYRSISAALGPTCMCNVLVNASKLVALPAATKCCKHHSAQLQVCVSQMS